MKVTCLFGSPRTNGNSAQIARRFLDEAEKHGAEVKQFVLNRLNFKGCQGCDVCKTKQDQCAVDDDLKPVLEAVRETDILVIATPVYYADVTSQLKAFIDRTYSFVDADYMTNPDASRLKKGKKLVFIQTQEAGEGSFSDVFKKYNLFFKFYGFEDSRFIHAYSIGQSGNMDERHEIFEQAVETAKHFCSG
jgi:multimeric flavodoxin WrbA